MGLLTCLCEADAVSELCCGIHCSLCALARNRFQDGGCSAYSSSSKNSCFFRNLICFSWFYKSEVSPGCQGIRISPWPRSSALHRAEDGIGPLLLVLPTAKWLVTPDPRTLMAGDTSWKYLHNFWEEERKKPVLTLSQWPIISTLVWGETPERRGNSHPDLTQGGWIRWENSNCMP